jgi:hypothetical protein
MKTAAIWACVITVLFACGCTSTLRYHQETRKVTIDSEPQGALVYQINPVNENEKIFLGTTPLKEQTVLVPTRVEDLGTTSKYAADVQLGMAWVVIEKDGYKPFVTHLATDKEDTKRYDLTLERK